MSDKVFESELFGYERGAFTGAQTARAGWFEQADGGTIFLDEIGKLPLAMQTKLLRTLQEGTITRLGAKRELRINVRLVTATNRDLETEVAAGTFRQDLYYRLNVIPIRLPSLAERRSDIPVLVLHFLIAKHVRPNGCPTRPQIALLLRPVGGNGLGLLHLHLLGKATSPRYQRCTPICQKCPPVISET